MTDTKAMAYVNMYGVLGTPENLCQLDSEAQANNDPISKISAEYTVDGDISLGIRDTAYITLRVRDRHFTTIKEQCYKLWHHYGSDRQLHLSSSRQSLRK